MPAHTSHTCHTIDSIRTNRAKAILGASAIVLSFTLFLTYESKGRADEVHAYLPAPGAQRSPVFKLSAQGESLFVERFTGSQEAVSYARFAFGGATTLDITVPSNVKSVRGVPEAVAARATFTGNKIHLPLDSHTPAVLFVETERGFLEKLFLLPDALETNAPDASRPDVVNAGALGLDASGRTLETKRLQAALDEAAARGGGTVLLPRGVFASGTLVVPSNVTLYLGEGSVLKGSRNPDDYPKDVFPDGRKERGSDTSIVDADVRFLGEFMTFSRLLLIDKAVNAGIRGRGTIDGDGFFLRGTRNAVPNLLRVRESSGVFVEDVLFRDAAAWTLHLLKSNGVTLRNVKILNDRATLNTDGIDVDASSDVRIENPFIYTKDDGICLKATNNSSLLADVQNVTVSGGLVSSRDAALKLGTESQAARFTNVRFENVNVFDSNRAFSVVVRDGAEYKDITFGDIRVSVGVEHLFEQVIGVRKDRSPVLGRIQNLRFENIQAPHFSVPRSNWTWYAQFRPTAPRQDTRDVPVFEGADGVHALDGLVLRDVFIRGTKLTAENARSLAGVTFGNFVRGVDFGP